MYRSDEALMLAGGWGSQMSRQSVHEGGKVVSPTHRPPLPPVFLALISIGGRVEPSAIVRPEGLCKWKVPTTYGNAAQCLKQLSHRVPRDSWGTNETWDSFFTQHLSLSSHYSFTTWNIYSNCKRDRKKQKWQPKILLKTMKKSSLPQQPRSRTK